MKLGASRSFRTAAEIPDYDYEETHDLRCGSQCPHFDELNRVCWLSWDYQEKGNYCEYNLKVDENGQIIYPDLSIDAHETRSKEGN